MGKKSLSLGVAITLLLLTAAGAQAADKLTLGTSARENPYFTLVVIAGDEKGFWKQNGLAVEWVPFRGGPDLFRAVAAGAIDVSMSDVSAVVAAAAGVPTIIVADMGTPDDFAVVVKSDLPIKEPKDLRGTRLGILRAGGASHSYGRLIAKALSLEGEIKFVAGGGVTEEFAAIKSGTLDGRVTALSLTMPLLVSGELRVVLEVKDYVPRPWLSRVVAARTTLAETKPDLVKRSVKAFLQAADFIMAHPDWNVAKMKSALRYSEEVARATLPLLRLTRDGRIDRRAVENVVAFLIGYGLLEREKAPAIDKLFTNKFTE